MHEFVGNYLPAGSNPEKIKFYFFLFPFFFFPF